MFCRWLAGYTEKEPIPEDLVDEQLSFPRSATEVGEYLAEKALQRTPEDLPRYSTASIGRWVAAIAWGHHERGFPNPCTARQVTDTLNGIRRSTHRPTKRASPLLVGDLRKVVLGTNVTSFPAGVKGTRDIALLVFGFAGAFRRSELSALLVGDVFLHEEDGLHVRVRSSKTDQEGRGQIKALPYGANSATCPPCAFRRWYRLLEAQEQGRPEVMRALRGQNLAIHVCQDPWTGTLPGRSPLFRSMAKTGTIRATAVQGDAIGRMVTERAHAAGIPARNITGHSLRSGFVTQAIRAGATDHQIMRQTGHKNPATVHVYARENAPLEQNAVTTLGL
ncbi:integrase [Frondihabitans peucedani]|uniref:Integrase n=2 Tax=Frondihabitans peucedani TaxID=598626 RepID=A0ABP8E335_9MICO